MVISVYRNKIMLEHLTIRDDPLALNIKAYAFVLLFCGRYPKVADDAGCRLRHFLIVLKTNDMINV